MFTAKDYVMPKTLDEAWQILNARKSNSIVAGCAWLRMGNKRIDTAVDLSNVGLDFINDFDDRIEIGAMTSYRTIETSPIINQYFNGILSKAVAPIIGVQFRNGVTVGGSVYSRFGFSDFLTPLLALGAQVKLYHKGVIALEDFLKMPYEKDILEMIIIPKYLLKASYQMLRNTEADFPIVNVAVTKNHGKYTVTVGARPQKAVIAQRVSEFLTHSLVENENNCLDDMIKEACCILGEEISFGSNMRASAQYREKIAKVLLKRALLEVEAC